MDMNKNMEVNKILCTQKTFLGILNETTLICTPSKVYYQPMWYYMYAQ